MTIFTAVKKYLKLIIKVHVDLLYKNIVEFTDSNLI